MAKTLKGKNLSMSASVIKAADGNLPTEIQLIPVGEWNTAFYGPMQVTLNHISQMAENFVAGIRKAVPVDVDHDAGKAAGWVESVIDKGADGLWGVIKWTKLGKELLGEQIYKLFSPEWSFDYIDPEHGTRHGAVLIAGSLTNRPLFKELDFLVASEGGRLTKSETIDLLVAQENNMTIEEILKKTVSERSEEEVKFVAESTELTDEQKSQLETEKTEAEATAKAEAEKLEAEKLEAEKLEAEKAEAAKKEQEEKEAAEKLEAERKAHENDNVTMKASELAELKANAELGRKANEELTKIKIASEVQSKFIQADDGMRIAPAHKEALVEFVMKCSDEQKTALYSILASVVPTKVDHKAGDDHAGDDSLTAEGRVAKLVTEKMNANEKLEKSEAIRQVLSENTKLANEYDQELKNK